ncbi:MAG: XisI protein, partial [Rhizonema sp. PD38]|nr:XisI protein [Rhizonema sp. PD38]
SFFLNVCTTSYIFRCAYPEELTRIFSCIIYVEIKDGKIWIERDGTEIGVANELVEAGVPKQDIVLGFKAPYKRKFTEFAAS